MTPILLLRRWVLTAGAALLVIDPAMWLAETWANSGYDSAGGHFFAVAAGEVERRYFERYGGSVAIADYGPLKTRAISSSMRSTRFQWVRMPPSTR
ncbi:MAG: hypothetical protein ACNA8W_00975 [Bradymonadaceae bacterium]